MVGPSSRVRLQLFYSFRRNFRATGREIHNEEPIYETHRSRSFSVRFHTACRLGSSVLGVSRWLIHPKSLRYILYLPISSSFRPSSHLRSSSLVILSGMLVASFELFRTRSSTKIGQSTRSASASASDGRESMLTTSPSRSSQMTA